MKSAKIGNTVAYKDDDGVIEIIVKCTFDEFLDQCRHIEIPI